MMPLENECRLSGLELNLGCFDLYHVRMPWTFEKILSQFRERMGVTLCFACYLVQHEQREHLTEPTRTGLLAHLAIRCVLHPACDPVAGGFLLREIPGQKNSARFLTANAGGGCWQAIPEEYTLDLSMDGECNAFGHAGSLLTV